MRKTGNPLARISARATTPEGGCFAAAPLRKTGNPLARIPVARIPLEAAVSQPHRS
jgi:hypothetical protein